MIGCHHQCNGPELGKTSGDGEERGGLECLLQSMGSRRVGYDCATEQQQQQHLSKPTQNQEWALLQTMDLGVIVMCQVSSSFVKIIPLWWMWRTGRSYTWMMSGYIWEISTSSIQFAVNLRNKVKFVQRKRKKHLLVFAVNIWTYWHG